MATLIEPGATIDGFTVGPLLHKGGMATLWEVTRNGQAFPMLMKRPIMAEGEDPAAIVSFEMEQMIMPRLSGPHVPAFALAAALDDLHRQHVIHLDLKPGNILFRPTGEAVLIDYGLAHHMELPDLMQEEFVMPYGSAPYMAPEQLLGDRGEPRSDLFALGALLYVLATGCTPFGEPQFRKGWMRRLWRDPVPPRALRPDLPPWLQEVILRLLEVDPDARYPTAAQLALDLGQPGAIALTRRAARLRQDPWPAVLWRRWHAPTKPKPRAGPASLRHALAPIILVAIDLAEMPAPLAELLRLTVSRLLADTPAARVACLNVLKQNLIAPDRTLDEAGENKHVQRLVQLKHWAGPLGLAEGRVTFHVIEAVQPGAAILDFVRRNAVDHVVMGARDKSTLQTLLGSVSREVASRAPCTVTIVRRRGSG
jgi:nucleotide-binding universal stress UspA family protein